MKIIIQTIIGLIIATTALGQYSYSPTVLPTTGGLVSGSGYSLSFTVGQPANLTFTAGGVILTQGFQQPQRTACTGVATINNIVVNGCNIVVYKSITYTTSTTIRDTIRTAQGCDSIYNVANIVVKAVNVATNNFNFNGCNSVVYKSKTYTSNAVVRDTVKSYQGCDSIYNVANIVVYKITAITNNFTLSDCNIVTYKTTSYFSSTVVKDTLKTTNGCDSIYNVVNIVINKITTTLNPSTLSGCNSVVYKGNTYTSSTVVRDTVKTTKGCDSVYNIATITVTPNVSPSVTIGSSPSVIGIAGGTSVLFTANATNGGSSPSYQWKKNGNNVGFNSSNYTDAALNNNDAITCVVTSNYICLTTPTATSNSLVVKVNTTISSFTPTSSSKGGVVTITGNSFTGATAVSFGGVAASAFAVINDNTINATVGIGATGSVSVTSPSGTTTKAGFVYTKALEDSLVLSPIAIVSAGGAYGIGNYNLSYSVGQTANITLNNAVATVTQGLQQPYIAGIAGRFIYPNLKEIRNVNIALSGNINKQINTGVNANYDIAAQPQLQYSIKPFKNNDVKKNNGVSGIDVILVTNHILNKSKLNSPYKLIAADVNNNKTITNIDIIFMKRLILGIDTTFTGNRLWAFVDSAHTFVDSTNPFPYKDSIKFPCLVDNKVNQTFIGVKLGDVNYDWNATLAKGLSMKPLELVVEQLRISNDELRIPITVKNFKDLTALQYTLNFNHKNYEFVAIENNKLSIEFNDKQAAQNGAISFLWNDAKAIARTLNDESELFTLVMKPKQLRITNSELRFDEAINNLQLILNNSITDIEAWDVNNIQHNIILIQRKAKQEQQVIRNDFTIFPNPTHSVFTIYHLPFIGAGTIVITDLYGKQVKTQALCLGNNTIDIANFSKGFYFVSVTTSEGKITKKLVVE